LYVKTNSLNNPLICLIYIVRVDTVKVEPLILVIS
jgi:hypothetical protein